MNKINKRFEMIKKQHDPDYKLAAILRLKSHYNELTEPINEGQPRLFEKKYLIRDYGPVVKEINERNLKCLERALNVTSYIDMLTILKREEVRDTFFVKNTFPFILSHECLILPIWKFIVNIVTIINILVFPSLTLHVAW